MLVLLDVFENNEPTCMMHIVFDDFQTGKLVFMVTMTLSFVVLSKSKKDFCLLAFTGKQVI